MSARDGHLNDLVAALVDGALDGAARDRALAHIAGCLTCRAEVDAQRQIKDRLGRLAGPEPPAGVVERLRGAIDADGIRPAGAGTWSPPARPGSTAPPTRSGSSRPPGQRGRAGFLVAGSPRRRNRRLAGALSLVALAVGAALAANGAADAAPAVSPPVGRFTVEHAHSTGGFPGADPAAGAVMTVTVSR